MKKERRKILHGLGCWIIQLKRPREDDINRLKVNLQKIVQEVRARSLIVSLGEREEEIDGYSKYNNNMVMD